MLGTTDPKLYSTTFLVLLGVLWNFFNLVITLIHHRTSRGFQTVSLIICSISLGNVFLHSSTFALVASISAGVFCWQILPRFLCFVLAVWLSSTCASFWSVAWLSVFYYIKVVSFTSALLRAAKRNISVIINVSLMVTLLTSCLMFTPFMFLQNKPHIVNATKNTTENATCIVRKIQFPPWVDENTYVVVFILYLSLFPLMIMLPMSLRLVIYLCKHTITMKKKKEVSNSGESYLLICRLTVALVGVYLITLLSVSLYYLHALFASVLSVDLLVYCCSFYCIASAVLLTCSNKHLRQKLRDLLCNMKRSKASTRGAENETAYMAS